MDYLIEIATHNSADIRHEAAKGGITHMREVERHGAGDARVTVYALPVAGGGEIRVADTSGDPVWEEADPGAFAELLESVRPVRRDPVDADRARVGTRALTAEERRALDEWARAEGRSRDQQVAHLLREALRARAAGR